MRQIKITVGRTGRLTPVAILDPVAVGGVVISQATLHNEDYVNQNRIYEGGWVYVYRAGDVIPRVTGLSLLSILR